MRKLSCSRSARRVEACGGTASGDFAADNASPRVFIDLSIAKCLYDVPLSGIAIHCRKRVAPRYIEKFQLVYNHVGNRNLFEETPCLCWVRVHRWQHRATTATQIQPMRRA